MIYQNSKKTGLSLKKIRQAKSIINRIESFEYQVVSLRDLLKKFHITGDLNYIKDIAVKLRCLICESSGNEGLLWRLLDKYGIDDIIDICLVGEVNERHPLAKGLTFSFVQVSRPEFGQKFKIPRKALSFKDVVKKHQAVYILGESYTHEELISTVANQKGTAHEDDTQSNLLSELEQLSINGSPPYIPIFMMDAELTIELAEKLLAFLVKGGDYRRSYNSHGSTLTLYFRPIDRPIGSILLTELNFLINRVSISIFLELNTLKFVINDINGSSHTTRIAILKTTPVKGIAVSLIYNEENKKIKILSVGSSPLILENIDLGYISFEDHNNLYQQYFLSDSDSYIEWAHILGHNRELTSDEVGKMDDLFIFDNGLS